MKHDACIDCRYYYEDWGSSCDHPKVKTFDPVRGWQPSTPRKERAKKGKCGPGGKLWEERPQLKSNTWKYLATLALFALIIALVGGWRPY